VEKPLQARNLRDASSALSEISQMPNVTMQQLFCVYVCIFVRFVHNKYYTGFQKPPPFYLLNNFFKNQPITYQQVYKLFMSKFLETERMEIN